MSMDEAIDFLEHFGVKGMRWGVRNDRKPKSRKQLADERAKAKRKKVAANRRTLKNEDLDKYIQRLEKEKKLRTLTAEDVEPGKVFARSITSQAGRTVLTAVATGAGMYAVRAALQGNFSAKEAADYLKPKKK